ncbi:hypothetical protein TKK_0009442 [Trichogramma kaykai]|uniref:DUF7041 domain-containing protein n=1 Tax=Trichogramma kaykai TaxID=54128 RepID=A0ABD2WZB5_9HYME
MADGLDKGASGNHNKSDVYASPVLSDDEELSERESTLKRRLMLAEEQVALLQHQLSASMNDSVNVSLHQQVVLSTSVESSSQSSTSPVDVKNTLTHSVADNKLAPFSFQNMPPAAKFNWNPTASPFSFGFPSATQNSSSSVSKYNLSYRFPPVSSVASSSQRAETSTTFSATHGSILLAPSSVPGTGSPQLPLTGNGSQPPTFTEPRNSQQSVFSPAPAVPQRSYNRPIKVPDFFTYDPTLCFKLLESEFSLLSITDDNLKFCSVITNAGANICKSSSAFLKSIPDAELEKYSKLKQHLISKYSQTVHQKMNQLLAGHVPVETVLLLWYRHLPTELFMVLDEAVTSANAPQAIAKADRLFEHMKHKLTPQVCAVASPNSSQAVDDVLVNKISEIVISAVSSKLELNSTRGRSRERQEKSQSPRSSSKPRFGENKDLCWYHHKYKEKARDCSTPPCAWPQYKKFYAKESTLN